MRMMLGLVLAASLGGGVAVAQTAPVAKTIADEAVSGDANKHAVTNVIDWPLGATTGRHSHPGDEYAVVIEGAVRVITDGQGEKTYTAGEAYHNARGLVHKTRTVGGVPAKTVAVFIVDKTAPVTQPAPAPAR